MSYVLFGFTILLILLIVLLAIPVELSFRINRVNRIQGSMNIRWLFGLARFSVNIPDTNKPEKTPSRRNALITKKPTQQQKHQVHSGPAKVIHVLKQSAFRRRFYRFINDLLRTTHSHDLYFRLRIGLGDPADTGRLWILLGPIAVMAANIPSAMIRIDPEFMDQVFEFQSRGEFHLMPLEFIGLIIGFILSPPTLRAWRTLRHR